MDIRINSALAYHATRLYFEPVLTNAILRATEIDLGVIKVTSRLLIFACEAASEGEGLSEMEPKVVADGAFWLTKPSV